MIQSIKYYDNKHLNNCELFFHEPFGMSVAKNTVSGNVLSSPFCPYVAIGG